MTDSNDQNWRATSSKDGDVSRIPNSFPEIAAVATLMAVNKKRERENYTVRGFRAWMLQIQQKLTRRSGNASGEDTRKIIHEVIKGFGLNEEGDRRVEDYLSSCLHSPNSPLFEALNPKFDALFSTSFEFLKTHSIESFFVPIEQPKEPSPVDQPTDEPPKHEPQIEWRIAEQIESMFLVGELKTLPSDQIQSLAMSVCRDVQDTLFEKLKSEDTAICAIAGRLHYLRGESDLAKSWFDRYAKQKSIHPAFEPWAMEHWFNRHDDATAMRRLEQALQVKPDNSGSQQSQAWFKGSLYANLLQASMRRAASHKEYLHEFWSKQWSMIASRFSGKASNSPHRASVLLAISECERLNLYLTRNRRFDYITQIERSLSWDVDTGLSPVDRELVKATGHLILGEFGSAGFHLERASKSIEETGDYRREVAISAIQSKIDQKAESLYLISVDQVIYPGDVSKISETQDLKWGQGLTIPVRAHLVEDLALDYEPAFTAATLLGFNPAADIEGAVRGCAALWNRLQSENDASIKESLTERLRLLVFSVEEVAQESIAKQEWYRTFSDERSEAIHAKLLQAKQRLESSAESTRTIIAEHLASLRDYLNELTSPANRIHSRQDFEEQCLRIVEHLAMSGSVIEDLSVGVDPERRYFKLEPQSHDQRSKSEKWFKQYLASRGREEIGSFSGHWTAVPTDAALKTIASEKKRMCDQEKKRLISVGAIKNDEIVSAMEVDQFFDYFDSVLNKYKSSDAGEGGAKASELFRSVQRSQLQRWLIGVKGKRLKTVEAQRNFASGVTKRAKKLGCRFRCPGKKGGKCGKPAGLVVKTVSKGAKVGSFRFNHDNLDHRSYSTIPALKLVRK